VFEIGANLAAAREAQGLTLADAENLTRIRAKQLAALEAERFEELPGQAYARAFLRTYAKALGLDAHTFATEFDERFPDDQEETELPRTRSPIVPRRVLPAGVLAAAAVAVVAVVVAIIVWTNSGPSTPSTLSLSVPNRPQHTGVKARQHAVHAGKPVADRRLVIRATRGNCWLLVRRGDADGPVLYEGTLTRGSVARFAAPRVWVRLGAPRSVDIQRGSVHIRGLPRDPTNILA
jgi:transcriptional regulator with XRE-family HTH domain